MVDPLAGSYFVEALTDAVEQKAREYLEKIRELGGAAEAIAYMQEEIHRSAYEHQLKVEKGDRVVVGVNRFQTEEAHIDLAQPDFGALEQVQREKLAHIKQSRDAAQVNARLAAVRDRGARQREPDAADHRRGEGDGHAR